MLTAPIIMYDAYAAGVCKIESSFGIVQFVISHLPNFIGIVSDLMVPVDILSTAQAF